MGRFMRLGWRVRSIRASTSLVVDVKTHRTQQHQALDNLLVVDPDAEDRHAIVHHAHDQRADHRAGDPPDTAIGRGSANKASRNDVELEAGPGLRRCGVEPRREHETSERGQHAHIDEGEEGQPLGLDTGELGRLLIAADRIDLPANRGARGDEAVECDQRDHDHHYVRQAAMRGNR